MKHIRSYREATRRDFLKGTSLLSAGLLLGKPLVLAAEPSPETESARSPVSFVTGTDRREMVYQAMKPFREHIEKGIRGKQVVIKPNFVATRVPLCATHADAVRGVLDFLQPLYSGRIVIAESSAGGDSGKGFDNYGYRDLEREYNVALVDLNEHPTRPVWIIDRDLHASGCQIISDFLDPGNYFISLTRLKTHDTVIATMGLKNIVMASPISQPRKGLWHKRRMHAGGPRWLHYNIFLLAGQIRPQFTVIDGLEGMEGDGPVWGKPVEHGVALAGPDVVAVDTVGAGLMGIPVEDIGYLAYCGKAGLGVTDPSQIDILGDKDPKEYVRKYQPHRRIEELLEWKKDLPDEGPA